MPSPKGAAVSVPAPLTRDEPKDLSGPDKAAAFILALGEEEAAKLLQKMDEDEIRLLSQSMVALGAVPAASVESLMIEFTRELSATGSLVGGFQTTEKLLASTLPPERAEQIMQEIRGPAGRTMWDKLGNVNENVLASYLKNEYPQTVAVVLSKIKPAHAARVLALFANTFALEVVVRMLRMETVQKDVLDHVENTLRTEFMTNLARGPRRDAHEIMAEIFNNFDRATEGRFMTALEERSSEAAERIKKLMFTFEDLIRVDAAGIQALLRKIAKDRLAIALKGASDPLKELFLGNMSERAAKMLREDMDSLGPVRLRDVDEAQAAVVVEAKAMAEAGDIVIAAPDGADELVY